jgi:hypothetical protein
MKFWRDMMNCARDIYAARHEPEGLRRLADFYWRGVLSLAFLIAACAILYGVWNILNVLNDLSAAPDTSASPPPPLDRTQLDATLNGFEARQAQFNALETTPGPTIPDPSK